MHVAFCIFMRDMLISTLGVHRQKPSTYVRTVFFVWFPLFAHFLCGYTLYAILICCGRDAVHVRRA